MNIPWSYQDDPLRTADRPLSLFRTCVVLHTCILNIRAHIITKIRFIVILYNVAKMQHNIQNFLPPRRCFKDIREGKEAHRSVFQGQRRKKKRQTVCKNEKPLYIIVERGEEGRGPPVCLRSAAHGKVSCITSQQSQPPLHFTLSNHPSTSRGPTAVFDFSVFPVRNSLPCCFGMLDC